MITSQYQSKGNIIGEKIAYKLGSSPSDRIPYISRWYGSNYYQEQHTQRNNTMSYFYLDIRSDEWVITRFSPCVNGRTPDPLFARVVDYPTMREVLQHLAGLPDHVYGAQSTIDEVYLPFYDGCKKVKVFVRDLDNSLRRLSEYSLKQIEVNRLPECKPKPIERTSRFDSSSFENCYRDTEVLIPDLVKITSFGDKFVPITKWEYKGEEISFVQAKEVWQSAHQAQRAWYLGGLPDCSTSWYSQEVTERRRAIKNPSWKDGVFTPQA